MGLKFSHLIIPLILLMTACTTTHNIYTYDGQADSRPNIESFKHCKGYGCTITTIVHMQYGAWTDIDKLFTPLPETAEQERERISHAIGLFERIIGPATDTQNDVKGTFKKTGKNQLDCVDERINTAAYLVMLKQSGYLQFHDPRGPVSRVPFFNPVTWPHQAAAVIEKETGDIYVVDSWFRDNGQDADIVSLEQWKKGWKPEVE